ncbi:MAG: indolepyruvate oxidoreductase [Deltaproteobacteria bacterium]|nr:indolepyruvate oxidoreductase [Deltaproteobacteria bacterium]
MTETKDADVRFLMGNEAIGRGAIEAGCSVAAAYPGTPSSEILESLVRWKKELNHPIYVEWSINEKVAFEVAYGASLAGARSLAAMKMVGLNVASDPYLSAAYLGVRGGLVVAVADDPGPHSSQTEQDSRFFAWFAKTPVLDPGTPAEALRMTLRAFEISEKYEVPALLRPCLRVCHARQNVPISAPLPIAGVGPFKKDWTRWAAIPKFRLILHRKLNEKLSEMVRAEPECRPRLISEASGGPVAIITSGSVSSHVRDVAASDERLAQVDVYKVDMPYPVDAAALQEIVDSHEKTLFVEETYPVLELHVQDRRKVLGRMTGHVPPQGELLPDLVEDIMLSGLGAPTVAKPAPQIKARRPSLCPGCPHRPAFYTIKKVFEHAIYSGDIGCYTLGVNMGVVDTCLCMGASIGMAGGLARAPQGQSEHPVVATIGDSTFFHAGIPALINAVHTKAPFVLVIMDNAVTAMTGGQPTPANDYLADGSPGVGVDMEKLIQGCGVESIEVVDPYDHQALQETLERARRHTFDDGKGVSVVIARRPCVRMPNVEMPEERYEIGEECDLCMSCTRDLECPAFQYIKDDKQMVIDEDLCAGCGFCVQVCPSQAIKAKGSAHA